MRNNIFIIKITHVIFAKCYYSSSGQYLETGWVNRLSRPLNRFSPGGNRLNRFKNRLNQFWPSRRQSTCSLRCQLRSLRCQFLLSVLSDCQNFRAVNTFFCALLLRSLTRNRLNRFLNRLNRFSVFWPADFPLLFLSLSPLLFFLVSFSNRRRPLFSLSPSHSTPKTHLCPLIFGRVVGHPFIPTFSIIFLNLIRISWLNLRTKVLPYFISLYSILRVLDYLMYHSLGTC
jgi:hypothetical protein